MLVDVSSERSCQISVMGEDDVSSLYQFTISSANTQPTDRGECTLLNLLIVSVGLLPVKSVYLCQFCTESNKELNFN